jgi:hypothetical protein
MEAKLWCILYYVCCLSAANRGVEVGRNQERTIISALASVIAFSV